MDIDIAGRLYDRAEVTRVGMRSMAWGLPLFWFGVAIGPFLAGENLPVSAWAGMLAPSLALTVLVVALALAVFWPAHGVARFGNLLVVSLAAAWIASACLQLSYVWPGGWGWRTSGICRVLLIAWIAFEIGHGAARLMVAPKAALSLVAEPGGAMTILGAPPAVRQLAAARALNVALFVLAAFLFAFGMMQLTLLAVIWATAWNTALSDCAAAQAGLACLDQRGWSDLMGQLILWPLGFIIAVVLGRLVRFLARRRAVISAADATQLDHRPPILFLRWFGDDTGALRPPRQTPLGLLFGQGSGEPTVDRMLVEEFCALGPTIALGDPNKPTPTFGVWRAYEDNSGWQVKLSEYARSAKAIVMVVDATETAGVDFELSLLADPALRAKTLFLAAESAGGGPHERTRIWTRVREKTGLAVPETAAGQPPILAAFDAGAGVLSMATSRRLSRSETLMALRWFFRGHLD